jgi:hypothetical protein
LAGSFFVGAFAAGGYIGPEVQLVSSALAFAASCFFAWKNRTLKANGVPLHTAPWMVAGAFLAGSLSVVFGASSITPGPFAASSLTP